MSDRERAAIEAEMANAIAQVRSSAWGPGYDELVEQVWKRAVAAYNAALQEPEGQASDPRAQSEAKQGSENPNSPSLLASSRAPKPADQKPGFHETMDREAVEPPDEAGQLRRERDEAIAALNREETESRRLASLVDGRTHPPRPERMCICGHTDHWHADIPGDHEMRPGEGSCQHNGECRCQAFRPDPEHIPAEDGER